MPPFKVYELGLHGVNVDKDPLELHPSELRQAQNAIHDTLGVRAGLRKRPGLFPLNATGATGAILGGISLPGVDTSASGATHYLYIGRSNDA